MVQRRRRGEAKKDKEEEGEEEKNLLCMQRYRLPREYLRREKRATEGETDEGCQARTRGACGQMLHCSRETMAGQGHKGQREGN